MLHSEFATQLPDAWRSLDRCRWMGRPIRAYETIDSTNEAAALWARSGVPQGALIVADHQTAGRGRHRRIWQADPGKNLLFSIILRPTLPLDRISVLPLLAGLAAAQAIDALASPVTVTLKWPNDLFIAGKKTGGILLESSQSGGSTQPPDFIVLGIGINVNQERFPADLVETATSLLLETGRFIARDALLAELLYAFEAMYEALGDDTASNRLLKAYETRMHQLGEHVEVRFPGGLSSRSGVLEGVSPLGELRLRTSEGEELFHAGDVSSRSIEG
jgi:BirA family transcriptional regulator, biotin operon repressor / biotin---[acetyl-CoA-carboxylase] ligase